MRVRDAIWKGMVRSHALWLAVIALVFLGLELLPDDFSRLFWIPIAIVAFSIPYGFVVARSACPRCRFSLQGMGFRLRTKDLERGIKHCPGCGLDLDTELSDVSPGEASVKRDPVRGSFLLGFGVAMVPAVLLLANSDPEPSGALPALVLLGVLGAACSAFSFHRSARTRRLSSALIEPASGLVCAVAFYCALGLIHLGLMLYTALALALVLAVPIAWAGPRMLGTRT